MASRLAVVNTATGKSAGDSEPAWGDPLPPDEGPRWTVRKTVTAVLVAAGIAAVSGLAVYAGTSGDPGGGPPGNAQLPGGQQLVTSEALHGDFVVDGENGFETVRTQRGEVVEVSGSSITVRSEDGYEQSYVADSATDRTVEPEPGATVLVTAKVTGEKAIADSIEPVDPRGSPPGMNGDRGQPGR
ncbi:hypothetical protein ABZ639_17500 [Saccharomonospora sp. NPDC006951]